MGWNELKEPMKEQEKKEPIFKSLKDVKQNRGIKILSYGNFSTGKTHFALTSNAPVFVIDTENGTGPLADKFPDAQVINICETIGEDTDEKDEVKNFENFQEAVKYLTSLPDEQIGTIVIDSMTDIWSWCQAYAKTKVFKIPIEERFKQQFDWGVPNSLMRKNVLKLINKNCNIIFTAREGELYAGAGQPTGKYKPEVQKKVPFFVDIVLYHEAKYLGAKGMMFQARIEKCRQNGELLGKIIENPTMNKLKEILIK